MCLGSLVIACGASLPPAESAPSVEEAPAPHEAAFPTGGLANLAPASHGAPAQARAAHSDASKSSAPDARRGTVGIKGITGSLTAFEVEQAMNTRQPQLLGCVQDRPRAFSHVSGDIAFHLDVDGAGKVERVLVTESNLGYPALEECLAAVVATAPLTPPAGAQHAETQWRMSVDPLGRAPEPLESADLEKTIERQVADTYESCSIPKQRRFLIHGYLGRSGKLSPLSVTAMQRKAGAAEDEAGEQMSCLAQALEQWRGWPKSRGVAKASFELRWMATPPAFARKGKKKRRRR